MTEIKFAKCKNGAVIPSKEEENGGFDIYACFDTPFMVLKHQETTLIPTGLISAFDKEVYLQMFNRGSNGSKGLLQACGVIDSGYRGEWFVAITNTCKDDFYIMKKDYVGVIQKNLPELYEYIKNNIYPYENAICQFVIIPVPISKITEISKEEIENYISNRGSGKLGSSGK